MPSAIDEAPGIGENAKLAYSRCSQYLHGNVATTALLPTEIILADDPIREWIKSAENALFALHHSLFVRYYDDLPVDSRDEWGDLASFRQAAGGS